MLGVGGETAYPRIGVWAERGEGIVSAFGPVYIRGEGNGASAIRVLGEQPVYRIGMLGNGGGGGVGGWGGAVRKRRIGVLAVMVGGGGEGRAIGVPAYRGLSACTLFQQQ